MSGLSKITLVNPIASVKLTLPTTIGSTIVKLSQSNNISINLNLQQSNSAILHVAPTYSGHTRLSISSSLGTSSTDSTKYIDVTAAETLSGGKIVSVFNNMALKADKDSNNDLGLLGITMNAAILNDKVKVILYGVMTEPTWSFNAGPVFLGNDGALTQIKPSTGIVILIGQAISATSLLVNIQKLYRRV